MGDVQDSKSRTRKRMSLPFPAWEALELRTIASTEEAEGASGLYQGRCGRQHSSAILHGTHPDRVETGLGEILGASSMHGRGQSKLADTLLQESGFLAL